MSIFHSSGAGVIAQDIMSKIRPRYIWLTDHHELCSIPPNWDGTEGGVLEYTKASAEDLVGWFKEENITPVVAIGDAELGDLATAELGVPVPCPSMVPEFHHGDIWVKVTRKGYFVVKRTA